VIDVLRRHWLVALALLFALSSHAVHAADPPAECRPNSGGSQNCTAPIPTPYNYLNASCQVPQTFDNPEAALSLWESMYKPANCPSEYYTPKGWTRSGFEVCINGYCGPGIPTSSVVCGGEPSVAPWYGGGGQETLAWLIFEIKGQSSPTGCTERSPFLSAEVRRQRGMICPDGYSWPNGAFGGDYCVQNKIDPLKSLGPQCPKCGNPITPSTGNKFQLETDYVGTGEYPLRFERYYNSQLRWSETTSNYFGDSSASNGRALPRKQGATSSPSGTQERRDAMRWVNQGLDIIGANWRHTYQRSIYYVEANSAGASTAFAFRHDGRVLIFTEKAGTYYAQPDINDRVVGNKTTGWTYTIADTEEVETYDPDGRLLSIRDRGGSTHTLQYGADGRLASVADDFGHTLTFTYAQEGGANGVDFQLVTMTDPAGAIYQYAYDSAPALSSVTYPDGAIRQYVMGGRALTDIIDENGATYATFTYNQYGEATGSTHALNAGKVTISYTKNGWVNWGNATVVDALNTSRLYQFTPVHGVPRLTAVSQPAASGSGTVSQAFGYDVNGNTNKRVDFRGTLSCYSFDLARNLETSRTEGLTGTSCPGTAVANVTRTTTTQWSPSFRQATQIDVYAGATATGTPLRRTVFTYYPNGLLQTRSVIDLTVTPNVTRTWSYSYDSYGRLLTENGPRTDVNDVTTYTYYTCTSGNECGRLHTITDAASHVTTYNTYNGNGLPLTITDANNVVTTLAYDSRMRLVSRQIGSETTGFTYWPTGLIKRQTLPDGSYVEHSYDAAHRLTQIADGLGNRIVYSLDAMGNQTAENLYDPSNALSQTRTEVFNSLNQLAQHLMAAGTPAVTTSFVYDDNGNQVSISAPMARGSTSQYDRLNRLAQSTVAGGGTSIYSYDANDNLKSVQDPRALVTAYQYNAFGDVKQTTSPDTGTTNSTYDSGGNLATRTDARNKTGTYSYDALNRVTSIAYPDKTVSYGYDAGANGVGRLTSASDANHSLAWTYDAQGRVTGRTQVVGSVSKSVTYGYNAGGQLATITTPSGYAIGYQYTNNRITRVIVNGMYMVDGVTYQPFGPVKGWTWNNGTQVVRSYDTDGRTTGVTSAGSVTLGYDDASRITSSTDLQDSAKSWSYGYDSEDRLTSAIRSGLTQSWTYDLNGNRLTEGGATPSTFSVWPTSNRLSSISGAAARVFNYSASGAVTADGVHAFTYDDSDRLISVSGTGTGSYVYNALGQRVKKVTANGTVYFQYDEAGHLIGEYDGSGGLIQEIVWMDDTPVLTLRPSSCGLAIFYIHTDHLNTPRKIAERSSPQIVWRWDSDPFGTSSPDEDADGDSAASFFNLRFAGQYFDDESGLHYNYMRDYDPAIGRYAESDPIGLVASLNTYAYVDGNPVSFFDSAGLARCTYTISTHTLVCKSNDGNTTATVGPDGVWSGLGQCTNNNSQQCIEMEDLGPVPPGKYKMNLDTRPNHPKNEFWRLEPVPKIPGWKCGLPLFGERCGFMLHPGSVSKGCITAARANDAAMKQYKSANELLLKESKDNTLTVVP